MKRLIALILIGTMALSLVSCSSGRRSRRGDSASGDLSGQWKQINSESEDSYQGAIIEGDVIEIYWVSNGGDTRSLYWSGSFEAPDTIEEPYSWESQKNEERTAHAMLSSMDDTKTFTYENGQISYTSSVRGTTSKIRLEKEEWEPGLKIEGNIATNDNTPQNGNFDNEPLYTGIPFSMAGVEFSLPDYYEEDVDKSSAERIEFRGTMGDLVELICYETLFEGITGKEFEQYVQDHIGEFEEAASDFLGADVKNVTIENLPIVGLYGCSMLGTAKSKDFDATIRLDIAYNSAESKALIWAFMQIGNPQYNYLQDYETMLNTAVVVTSPSDSPSSPEVPSGIRPEFKEAMDSYEAFFDEYIAFMQRFSNSNDTFSMLADYARFMEQFSDTMEAMDDWGEGDLSTEETAYYLEVTTRINTKLLNSMA